MARLLFASYMTYDDQVFLINHPEIAGALGVDVEEKRRYSINQLQAGLDRLEELAKAAHQINEKDRDIVENEIIRVFRNIELYSLLTLNFTFAFPDPSFTVVDRDLRKILGLHPKIKQFSFLDIALKAGAMHQLSKPLETLDVSQWSFQQKEIMGLISNVYAWANNYNGLPLAIVPSYDKSIPQWYSPWDIITQSLRNEIGRVEMVALRDMMEAYWNGEQLDFDLAVKTFRSSVSGRIDSHPDMRAPHIGLEVFFNRLNPFLISKAIYFFTFILFCISLLFHHKWIYRFGVVMILSGVISHSAGLILLYVRLIKFN